MLGCLLGCQSGATWPRPFCAAHFADDLHGQPTHCFSQWQTGQSQILGTPIAVSHTWPFTVLVEVQRSLPSSSPLGSQFR